MSIFTCKCGTVFDTDYEMESIKGEPCCDKCYQMKNAEKQTKRHSKKVFSDTKQAFYLGQFKQGAK